MPTYEEFKSAAERCQLRDEQKRKKKEKRRNQMKTFMLGFFSASTLFLATLVLYVGFCPKSCFKARPAAPVQAEKPKAEEPRQEGLQIILVPVPGDPTDIVPQKPAPNLEPKSQPNFEGLFPFPDKAPPPPATP